MPFLIYLILLNFVVNSSSFVIKYRTAFKTYTATSVIIRLREPKYKNNQHPNHV